MVAYYAHDVIKIQNLAKILSVDPYYSSSDNLSKVFFTEKSIPTIASPVEMIYEWESHGLVPFDNNNIDVLKTRKYSVRSLQSFFVKHNLPLPGALFPDGDNNTSSVYFTPLAAKFFGTEHQKYFVQKRQKNDLLNKFFFNSETVHREDYYQFETTPISQPEESDRIREDALKEVQSVWLELKRNKFTDELRIVQEWIDEYLPSKAYFAQWKHFKELSEVEDRIHEYESHAPTSITEINIRERVIAELQNRQMQLKSGEHFKKISETERDKISTPTTFNSNKEDIVRDLDMPVAEKQELENYSGVNNIYPEEILKEIRTKGDFSREELAKELKTRGVFLEEIGRLLRKDGEFDSVEANKKRGYRLSR